MTSSNFSFRIKNCHKLLKVLKFDSYFIKWFQSILSILSFFLNGTKGEEGDRKGELKRDFLKKKK